MHKSAGLMLLGAGALAVAGSASALDLAFTPRISVGAEKYSLKWSGYNADGSKYGNLIDVDGYVPTVTLGGTVSMGNIYLDAYWQQTGSVDDYNEFSRDVRTWDNESEIDHRDYALSVGYGFDNGATLFAGYKNGKANIDNVSRRRTSEFSTISDAKFTADGPFVGAGYGWRLGPGILSVTAAWAWLDGKTEATDRLVHDTTGDLQYTVYSESKPSASGLALSLAWKAPITDRLSYAISLDGYQYEFDTKAEHGSRTFPDGTVEPYSTIGLKVEEQSVGVRASLAYHF